MIVKQARHYLLRRLSESPVIRYSVFYDGTDETAKKLADGMGITQEEADWYSAEGSMDEAAALLEQVGWINIRILDDKLADGEQDYEIALTEKGRKALHELPDDLGKTS